MVVLRDLHIIFFTLHTHARASVYTYPSFLFIHCSTFCHCISVFYFLRNYVFPVYVVPVFRVWVCASQIIISPHCHGGKREDDYQKCHCMHYFMMVAFSVLLIIISGDNY